MLGLVMLTPWLVARFGQGFVRLGLPIRVAARDAVRNRGRTAPAVAAVLGATAAMVALMVATSSQVAYGKKTYRPDEVMGAMRVSIVDTIDGTELAQVRDGLAKELPGVPVIESHGVAEGSPFWLNLDAPECVGPECLDIVRPIVIGDRALTRYYVGHDMPADGKVVVLRPGLVANGQVKMQVTDDKAETSRVVSLPAVEAKPLIPYLAQAVIPATVAAELGVKTVTDSLLIDPSIHKVTPAEEERITRRLSEVARDVHPSVERGYPESGHVVETILMMAAAILVLGGTLVATGLAAADSHADMATLAAIGAAPRTRRLVTMAQAGFIATVGVVIGTIAGFVPGVAATWPLTASNEIRVGNTVFLNTHALVGPTIDVPWRSIGLLVIGLPLLAALIAGLFTRSRLPVVARRPT